MTSLWPSQNDQNSYIQVDCKLPISPGTVPVVVTAVATAVAVVDVVGNISVVIIICVVSLGTLLVDTSGAVVEVSSAPALVTMVAGCTELNLVGNDVKADDSSSVE